MACPLKYSAAKSALYPGDQFSTDRMQIVFLCRNIAHIEYLHFAKQCVHCTLQCVLCNPRQYLVTSTISTLNFFESCTTKVLCCAVQPKTTRLCGSITVIILCHRLTTFWVCLLFKLKFCQALVDIKGRFDGQQLLYVCHWKFV